MVRPRQKALSMLLVTVGLGCGAPLQNGMIEVGPGASERFEMALRLGYLGPFDRAMVPAEARPIAFYSDLPEGGARAAGVGDYLLENGHFLAAIKAPNGRPDGGMLIDLIGRPRGVDAVLAPSLSIGAGPFVFESIRLGTPPSTLAHTVQVSGLATGFARGAVEVTQRYDVAPGTLGVIIHTHLKGDLGCPIESDAAREASGGPALFREDWPAERTIRLADDALMLHTAAGPYLLRVLSEGGPIERGGGASVERACGDEDVALISRMVTPLERGDSVSGATAIARIDGTPIGELSMLVRLRRTPLHGGTIYVEGERGVWSAQGLTPEGENASLSLSLPAGSYRVYFAPKGRDIAFGGARVTIREGFIAPAVIDEGPSIEVGALHARELGQRTSAERPAGVDPDPTPPTR